MCNGKWYAYNRCTIQIIVKVNSLIWYTYIHLRQLEIITKYTVSNSDIVALTSIKFKYLKK